ncbi:MAG: polysaccharide deacetylase family protein [Clostridium argentinense]|uniref:polysaccharide deacetylase family protein n=1 Tax=uncultured Clostridium sp. TaxID=59620 RepID=UPI001E0B8DD6|nr:polysaccharide deacetylase family protein [uncultured Clostridium sp.]MBS5824540.1 polysaccharide deacetylase family protein [Clostridium argentinense]MDU1350014.1 polysaccharide deacetylase family protein [Clostridium argentinense]
MINSKYKKFIPVIIIVLILISLIVISNLSKKNSNENDISINKIEKGDKISRYNGKKSKEISYVYTTKKELTLTFSGMGDEKMMKQILDELDKFKIKAVFFLPGIRVAEEPDIAQEILKRGHEIENNTLNRKELTELSYEDIYKEVQKTNEILKKEIGVTPKYLRTKSGAYNEDVLLVAAQTGLDAVVTYSINPKDWDMKSAEEIGSYVEKYITRGGIIALNTDKNPQVIKAISLIAKAVDDVGYKLVSLDTLLEGSYERKPLQSIKGYDAAKINENAKDSEYNIVYKADTDKNEIALTFDDWGRDITVTKILDILDKNDIKASFFLRGNGVEQNPNLAKAIAEAGHDVANHSYSHPIITSITAEEIASEVIKCHQVLTEAIQEQPKMLFRPPTGEINDSTAKIIAACGYETIALFDVSAHDWDVNNSPKEVINFIVENTNKGSIILLHLQENSSTLKVLPDIIEHLKNKGYSFTTVSKLLNK